jgi:hypothetical protein
VKTRTGVGLGLIAGGASLQASQGVPTSDIQWATFALNALMSILGIFFAVKGDPADRSVFPNSGNGRLPR